MSFNSKVGAPQPFGAATGEATLFAVLVTLSVSHLLNDTVQSLLPAVYPILKTSFRLSFSQVGLITLAFQLTGSLLQPMIGLYTDRNPKPYSLPFGMGVTLCGLVLLAFAGHFYTVLIAAALIGVGSSVFHPESSRVARLASGGQHGLAQSLFQVGGNTGAAIGPLLAALVIVPFGQRAIAWLALLPLMGIFLLANISRWYAARIAAAPKRARPVGAGHGLTRRHIAASVAILLALMFSKFVYLASFNSYYTFYLIQKFHLPVQTAQICLFVFLGASALGTFFGGPIGDRIGRRYVIWGSILGVLPFTLALPYANLPTTIALSFIIGFVLSSAFAAIVVYAQELLPERVGAVAGLFFGLAFGIAGLGAALLGVLADATSITFVYQLTAFLPLIGILAYFLPRNL
ncbi:MFS transporter [uncultured Methylovirgula sp.]|uniref:MFS transporter n=1 Tax=uncultured Methylovirgula sp. TaxID=1285960 RepID=UPI00261243E2|nr:MFS transporter [uncultured Methylovirgula sp.]